MAEAYEAAAAAYDRQVEGDAWMRQALWDRYARLFRSGQTVLDAGCGTGIDAVFLAQRGIRVVAIDASAAMIAEAGTKLAGGQLQDLVRLRVMDIGDLDTLPDAGFDGIIAAFAGLSAVADLDGFAAQAARLLGPRGIVLVHMLNRSSLWEWLGLVRAGRVQAARRLGRNPERNFIIGGHRLQHYLYHPSEAYARFFARRFKLRRAYGLGIIRPPHTMHRVAPVIAAGLGSLERPLRAVRPLRNWGRFFVLELEKR